MNTLNKSEVVFNQEDHTYTLNGKSLQGITPLISWAYPTTYTDIPQSVLDNAAERGSLIHEQCELADSLGVLPTSPEAIQYLNLKQEHGLTTMENEYLVSDNKDIASSIDVVFTDFSLADIKCTSQIHYPNVTLQLSIYAYLFELNNPSLTVNKLYVIWLPKEQYGKPKFIALKRIPTSKVKKVIKAYLKGESRDSVAHILGELTSMAQSDKLPEQVVNAEQQIINIETQLKALKEQQDTLKSGLLALMQEYGVKKWETDNIMLTRVLSSKREDFDKKQFQADNPELYKQYIKETTTSESIRIKVKQIC